LNNSIFFSELRTHPLLLVENNNYINKKFKLVLSPMTKAK